MSSTTPDDDATPWQLLFEIQRQLNANPKRSAAALGRITKNSGSPAKLAAAKKKVTSKATNRPVRHLEKTPRTTKKTQIGSIEKSPASDGTLSGAPSPFSNPSPDASPPSSDTSIEDLEQDVDFEPDNQSKQLFTPSKRNVCCLRSFEIEIANCLINRVLWLKFQRSHSGLLLLTLHSRLPMLEAFPLLALNFVLLQKVQEKNWSFPSNCIPMLSALCMDNGWPQRCVTGNSFLHLFLIIANLSKLPRIIK